MSEPLQDSFAAQLAKSRKSSEELTRQLNAKADAEIKSDQENARIASIVLAAMARVPKPKNGIDGVDGKDGLDGVDGFNGINGVDGKQGPIGKTGPKGETGKTGPAGVDGKFGAVGATGKDGIDGIDGKDGEAGADGANGLDGKDGKDGVDGKNGVDGLNGKDGRDGKDGKNGGSLLSVKSSPTSYIFTMDNGNTFDVDFPAIRAAGVGKDGTDGVNGTNGKNGKTGSQGIQGKPGKTGSQGKRGEHGVGIKDISTENSDLKIKLTDGSVKKVKLPGTGGAPIAPMSVQRAKRTPLEGPRVGLTATNVEDAFQETLGKIQQAASGNPFDVGTAASFMFDFNTINDTHSSNFVYNGSNQLINTFVVNPIGTVLYSIAFTYIGKELESKVITNVSLGDSVDTTFTYTNGQLTSKVLTYVSA